MGARIKSYEQILTDMIAKIVGRTRLNDVSQASFIKHILEASALSDAEIYFSIYLLSKLFNVDSCNREDLIERAKEILPGDLSIQAATKSFGTVVFFRNSFIGTISKNAGIKVKTPDGLEFITTPGFTITPTKTPLLEGHVTGQDSTPVPIAAMVAGEASNVATNSIIKFSNKPIGIDGVINTAATVGGIAEESVDSIRGRLKKYVRSLARAHVSGLEFAVLNAEDPETGSRIIYSKCVETIGHVTLYIDDGTGYARSLEEIIGEVVTNGLAGPPANSAVGGETHLFLDYISIDLDSDHSVESSISGPLYEDTDYYINPASGQINFVVPLEAGEVITANYFRFTGLIAIAQKIIEGDPLNRLEYPGFRGGGVLVQVKTPQVLIQNIDISLIVLEGYDIDLVKDNVKTAISNYVNTLNISDDLILTMLIATIKNIKGVYDLIIKTPSSNILVLDDQLLRTSSSNIMVR